MMALTSPDTYIHVVMYSLAAGYIQPESTFLAAANKENTLRQE